MKKITLLSLIITTYVAAFADYENYDGQDVSGQNFYWNSLKNSSWVETNATSTNFEFATLTNANFTSANLTSANVSCAKLTGVNFTNANLDSVVFGGQKYNQVGRAELADAIFTNATITNASFNSSTAHGFTKEQLYSTKNYQDKDLSGISLCQNDLSGWDFSEQNLTSTDFSGADLTGSNFTNANLTSTNFSGADLTGSNFTNVNMVSVKFSTVSYDYALINVNFTNADFSTWNGYFMACTLTGSNFTNANLTSLAFYASDLTDVNFTDATINNILFSEVSGFTKEQLYSTKNYQDKDLSGMHFYQIDMHDFNFSGQNLKSTNFTSSDLRNANFTSANLTSTIFTSSDLSNANLTNVNANSANFSSATLTSANFTGANLTSADFTNANLNMADFENAVLSGAKLGNADLTNANIRGADLTSTVSNGFTEAQLKSTVSYQMGDLRGVMFDYNNISNWDLSGQKLQNASFFATRITNVNFSFSDLRGADMIAVSGAPIYKTTIMSDGVIKNFTMTSEAESFNIYKYTPAAGGGEMISAKISEVNARVSGGATLTLETGAALEVVNNKTLTIASDGNLVINTDAAGSTLLHVENGAGLAFEDGAILRINIEGVFSASDVSVLTIMGWEDDSHITGVNVFEVDETLFLTVNGEAYAGDWNYRIFNKQFQIVFEQIPEPAFYAALLGVFALAFAARRRKAK